MSGLVTSAAASMGERTVVPVLAALRLGTAAEQGWRQSGKTSGAEEEEERREQMDSIG